MSIQPKFQLDRGSRRPRIGYIIDDPALVGEIRALMRKTGQGPSAVIRGLMKENRELREEKAQRERELELGSDESRSGKFERDS